MKCKYGVGNLDIYKYSMPLIASNMYVIPKDQEALIIDPNESKEAFELLIKHNVQRAIVILTHEHYDHISGVNVIRELIPDCTVYSSMACKQRACRSDQNLSAYFMAIFMNRPDQDKQLAEKLFCDDYYCEVDVAFEGEYDLIWKGIQLHMVETPGHSPGSICIVAAGSDVIENDVAKDEGEGSGNDGRDQSLFSGDSLIQGTSVITRLPGGDKEIFRTVTKPFLDTLPESTIVFPGHGDEFRMKDYSEQVGNPEEYKRN